MNFALRGLLCGAAAMPAVSGVRAESRLVTGQFETRLLPAALKFTVLLPDGQDSLTVEEVIRNFSIRQPVLWL